MTFQAACSEVSEPAACIQDHLAARPDPRLFVARFLIRRDLRSRQHLDAVYLERRRSPLRRDELDQRVRETRNRLKLSAGPVVDRSFVAALEIRKLAPLPAPASGAGIDQRRRAIEVER